VRKNYAANVVCYLPMDSPAAAKAFLQFVKPSLVLWVKYEYWYFYLTEIRNQNIPLLLISGIFRPSQPFFQWYGGLHRKMLQSFTALFVQNEPSAQLAAGIAGGEKVQITGDTRFDRVVEIAENFKPIPIIEQWLGGAKKVMVCGSTWDEDEKELSHYVKLHPEIKFIIAPHNVNEEEIAEIQLLLPDLVLYTNLEETLPSASNKHVLIINTVGILSRLYYYATITYVGGGFGGGIHNVLEAAVYGKPVVHGPEYTKFAEAKDLVALGGSYETEDALHLEKLLDHLFNNQSEYNTAAAVAKEYVYSHKGASAAILNYIQEKRLLTNE
jgi:3-deoxy-D-manno-octulosonic-acid transferase